MRRRVVYKGLVHRWWCDEIDDSAGGGRGTLWEGWFSCGVTDGTVAMSLSQLEAKFVFAADDAPLTCLSCLALPS